LDGHYQLDKTATNGTIYYAFTALRISSEIIPLVIDVAAIGAIALTLISLFPASFASVLVKPTKPAFAVE